MPPKQRKAVVSSSSSSSSSSRARSVTPQQHHEDKYVPPQYSILMEYVLNPFYTKVAEYFPRWWSPNGITLFGITCTILASLLFFTDAMYPVTNSATTQLPTSTSGFEYIFDPRPTSTSSYQTAHGASAEKQQPKPVDPKKPAGAKVDTPATTKPAATESDSNKKIQLPAAITSSRDYKQEHFVDVNSSNSWVFILCGVLNWIYIIADNTDGKHARRYKTSSAIGEYLDHGLDTVTALLSCFVVGAAAGERIAIGFLLQVGCSLMMVCSHYHHWDKNVFIWGDRLFSVDEAMVLISTYPLLVGLFPGVAQSAVLFTTGMRVVQWFVCMFAVGISRNIVDFMRLNFRIVNPKTNPLFLFEVLLVILPMTYWAVFHRGGMSDDVQVDMKGVVSSLGPYLNWNEKDHFAFPARDDKMPPVVRHLYHSVVLLCPPYLLRIIGSRVLKLLVTYPACWAITMACATSTLVHIPIAAKCLKEKTLSYTHLAGVLLSVYTFGVSPTMGTIISVVWHVVQIVLNCCRLEMLAVGKRK